jgi:hypothetical protein
MALSCANVWFGSIASFLTIGRSFPDRTLLRLFPLFDGEHRLFLCLSRATRIQA